MIKKHSSAALSKKSTKKSGALKDLLEKDESEPDEADEGEEEEE